MWSEIDSLSQRTGGDASVGAGFKLNVVEGAEGRRVCALIGDEGHKEAASLTSGEFKPENWLNC